MPIVNYVREHERFIEYAADEELTASDRCLWYALMHIFNQRANGNDWPGDFIPITNKRLFMFFPGGFDTLVRSRNKLKQKKLIDFHAGNRNQAAPMYKILYFYPENTDKKEFYPQNTDNIRDNMTGNIHDNTRDNIRDNMGYLYTNINKEQYTVPKPLFGEEDEEEDDNRAGAEAVMPGIDGIEDRELGKGFPKIAEEPVLGHTDVQIGQQRPGKA